MAIYDGMMGTAREQITDYNKDKMFELSENVNRNYARFDELTRSVEAKITEMEQYWAKNDEDAQKLYTDLKGNFQTFKKELDQALELIGKFKERVDDQVDSYATAERQSNKAING